MVIIAAIFNAPLYSELKLNIVPAYTYKAYEVTKFMIENSKNPKAIYRVSNIAAFFNFYPVSFFFLRAKSLKMTTKR